MRQPDPRGAFLTVDGRRMHVVTAGPPTAAPLVLLEAGAFGFSADWAVVQARLAARSVRSLAYDRAGLGLSEPGPSPRDGLAIAYDLERLLGEAGEPGPYLLVGHSMAGLHTQLFAGRNRDRIAGLVLVDAITPLMARDRWFRLVARPSHHVMRAAGAVAGAGLLGPFRRWGDTIGLDGAAREHKHWAFADAAHNRYAAEEVGHWEATVAQALAVGPLDPIWPVAVVTAGAAGRVSRLKDLQAAPAKAARQSHVDHVGGANHASLLGLAFADRIVAAIELVLKAGASK
jgi:pimeloyl-ACP methyl ester carboxylesterase